MSGAMGVSDIAIGCCCPVCSYSGEICIGPWVTILATIDASSVDWLPIVEQCEMLVIVDGDVVVGWVWWVLGLWCFVVKLMLKGWTCVCFGKNFEWGNRGC